MTDCDEKERSAISAVFPRAERLLCRFHIMQCIRNHRNKQPKKLDSDLKNVLSKCVESMKSEKLDSEIVAEVECYRQLVDTKLKTTQENRLNNTGTTKYTPKEFALKISAYKDALKFIDYLKKTWLNPKLMSGWSHQARVRCAVLLGVKVADVPTTNNNVESFNNVLKYSIGIFAKSSHLPRIDELVRILVDEVTPMSMRRLKFAKALCAHRQAYQDEKAAWNCEKPDLNGTILFSEQEEVANVPIPPNADNSSVFFEPDQQRDERADELIYCDKVSDPTKLGNSSISFTVGSAIHSLNQKNYFVILSTMESTEQIFTCTCQDFYFRRSQFCKHMRAAKITYDSLSAQQPCVYPKCVPPTRNDDRQVHSYLMDCSRSDEEQSEDETVDTTDTCAENIIYLDTDDEDDNRTGYYSEDNAEANVVFQDEVGLTHLRKTMPGMINAMETFYDGSQLISRYKGGDPEVSSRFPYMDSILPHFNFLGTFVLDILSYIQSHSVGNHHQPVPNVHEARRISKELSKDNFPTQPKQGRHPSYSTI